MAKHAKKKTITLNRRKALGIMLLLLGVVFLFGSDIYSTIVQVRMDERIDQINKLASLSMSTSASSEDEAVNETAVDNQSESNFESSRGTLDDVSILSSIDPSILVRARDVLSAYNKQLSKSTQCINDPFGLDKTNDDLSSFGIQEGLVGYIAAPSMNCMLPLYLGASNANMAKGAAVLSGTSMPLGGTDSNCVIAGHRGWSGAVYFRNIDDACVGDPVVIATLWDELGYRVVEKRIIDPDDVQALTIVPGRDLVTLFTCHPYGHNYQRILLICERSGDVDTKAVIASMKNFFGEVQGSTYEKSSLDYAGDHVLELLSRLKSGQLNTLDVERIVKLLGFVLLLVVVLKLLLVRKKQR